MNFRRIGAAYGSSYLAFVTALLSSLWLLRVVADTEGQAAFGLLALVTQIAWYLGLLQCGLDAAASQRIAESLGRGDRAAAAAAYGHVRRFNRVAAGLCIGLTGVGAWLAGRWVAAGDHPELASAAVELAIFAGLAQTFIVVSRPSVAALLGSECQPYVNTLRLVTGLFAIVLGYIGVVAGFGVASIPAAECLGFLGFLVGAVFLRRRYCPWVATEKGDERSNFRSFVGHGLWLLGGTIGWAVEYHCDIFVIRAVTSIEAVAVFSAWARFPQLAQAVYVNLVTNSLPSLTAWYAADRVGAARASERVNRFGIGLGGAILICLGVWLPNVVGHWLPGDQYDLPRGGWMATSLGLTVVLRAFGLVLVTAGQVVGQYRLTVILIWLMVIVRIAAGWFATSADGIYGAAAAGAASWIVFDLALGAITAFAGLIRVRVLVLAAAVFGACSVLAALAEPFVRPLSLVDSLIGMGITATVCGLTLLLLFGRIRHLRHLGLGPRS